MILNLTAASVRRTAPAALIAKLGSLPDLDLLAEIPAEVLLALPVEVLEWRRAKLLASRKGVSMKQLPIVIGSGDKHVQRLRKNYLDSGEEGFDALPAPDPELSDDDIRRPGDGKTCRGGSARWTLGDLVRWLIERERTDEDRNGTLTLLLRPGGRKPPGRTPSAARVPAPRVEQVSAGV